MMATNAGGGNGRASGSKFISTTISDLIPDEISKELSTANQKSLPRKIYCLLLSMSLNSRNPNIFNIYATDFTENFELNYFDSHEGRFIFRNDESIPNEQILAAEQFTDKYKKLRDKLTIVCQQEIPKELSKNPFDSLFDELLIVELSGQVKIYNGKTEFQRAELNIMNYNLIKEKIQLNTIDGENLKNFIIRLKNEIPSKSRQKFEDNYKISDIVNHIHVNSSLSNSKRLTNKDILKSSHYVETDSQALNKQLSEVDKEILKTLLNTNSVPDSESRYSQSFAGVESPGKSLQGKDDEVENINFQTPTQFSQNQKLSSLASDFRISNEKIPIDTTDIQSIGDITKDIMQLNKDSKYIVGEPDGSIRREVENEDLEKLTLMEDISRQPQSPNTYNIVVVKKEVEDDNVIYKDSQERKITEEDVSVESSPRAHKRQKVSVKSDMFKDLNLIISNKSRETKFSLYADIFGYEPYEQPIIRAKNESLSGRDQNKNPSEDQLFISSNFKLILTSDQLENIEFKDKFIVEKYLEIEFASEGDVLKFLGYENKETAYINQNIVKNKLESVISSQEPKQINLYLQEVSHLGLKHKIWTTSNTLSELHEQEYGRNI
ncbi:hypothetical protein B5S31_g2914 [[Candida] boidinii]|nr:hypothetical protein B5S31_g2914 [[Candida] boidinii]OWB77475.1 hypothetical protein B5S32_g1641 [[Candida] boidinii]